jgi:2-succinyl-5-enolpyruvyl-6-hydroxy-3-cyclohexene-1-carboxylate synthase
MDTLAGALSGRPGLVVVGAARFPAESAAALGTLAGQLDCVICADPLSGLRFGRHDRSRILGGYDSWLRNPEFAAGHRAQWILQLGAAPTSAVLQRYLDEHDEGTRRFIVTPAGPWPDPGRRGHRFLHADPLAVVAALQARSLEPAAAHWCAAFLDQERRFHQVLADPAQCPPEAAILADLVQRLPAQSRVFAGNSMVIRDCDSFLPGGGTPLVLLANRGASGIDGNVSTVLGLAAGSAVPVVGLLGDLALYHDMNGLLAAREVDAKLVVFRNGGGAIFGYLPQAGLEGFARYWLTDPGLDCGAIARLYGLNHARVAEPSAFGEVFAQALQRPGSALIEVVIDRTESRDRHRAFWSRFSG